MREEDFRAQLQASLGTAYTLERELGGGGMSRVFVATETSLDRPVVLKVLPPDMGQGVSIQRFTREIRLAAKLQHPHIVPLLSSGEALGLPWFTMPFVEGESLRAKLVRGGELPIADSIRTLREIASALAYAHEHGVVHRDIKPENVLLSAGTALVSDFGVAKAIAEAGEAAGVDLTSRGVALGTPSYMAPEQSMADPRTDQRADIYAFGVVAFELLTGRTPFAGRSPQATLAAHITETPESVERIRTSTPPALAVLVMQCLAKSPADRPQGALELVHALDALVTPTSSTPASVAAAPLQSPLGNGARTWSRRAVSALVAVVLVVAAGGWYGWTRLREPLVLGRRIAVAPFKNETGDSLIDVIGRLTADVLSRALSRGDSTDVVPLSAVTAAMKAIPRDQDIVSHLASATHASIVVDGTIYGQGDSLRFEATVTDVRTGQPIRTLDPARGLKRDPAAAIESLRDRLLGALQVPRSAFTMVRATKLSAYREFDVATSNFGRDYPAARASLHRAIALDSTFVGAYSWLAITYSNTGLWDSSAAVVEQLGRFQDQMSSDELDLLETLRANLSGNIDRLLIAARKLASRDSSFIPMYNTGLYANWSLRPRLALAALLKSDSAALALVMPWGFQVEQLANAYHLNGLYAEELEMLQRSRASYPNEPGLRARGLRALAALRRNAEARALADTLLRGTIDPANTSIVEAVNVGAMEFEAHGDSMAGANLAGRVNEWYATHPTKTPSGPRDIQEGIGLLLVGKLDAAEQAFIRAARDTSHLFRERRDYLDASGYLGLTLARRGQSARARAIADSLGSLQQRWLFGSNTFWHAAIYSELGETEAAIRLLGQAYQEGVRKNHWHYSHALRSLRGYPSFEALIKPQG